MSDSTDQQAVASKAAEVSNSSDNQTDASQAQKSNGGAGVASTEVKDDAAPARQPVQLKSHFKGMPKDWPINRNKGQ
ncbi:hypothetical protein SCUP234_12468 [Seiridium cupressi]